MACRSFCEPQATKFVENTSLKDSLSNSDVQGLRALRLDVNSIAFDARNIWLFSLFAKGMHPEDILLLKWGSITNESLSFVEYRSRQRRHLRMTPKLHKLLSRYAKRFQNATSYVFPFLDRLGNHTLPEALDERLKFVIKELNKELKYLRKDALIKPRLTLASARPTYARLVYEQTKDLKQVQKALGHKKTETTFLYLSLIRGLELEHELADAA